jgi:hypothetical protein
MQGQVRLTASAIPLTFPASLNINAGSAEHPGLVARRIMVAVLPTGTARGIQSSAPARCGASTAGQLDPTV